MVKIAIIGSGLAGISTALLLKDQAEITLFEKARGVSGRMSTRWLILTCSIMGLNILQFEQMLFVLLFILFGGRCIARWNANYVELDRNKIMKYKDWAKRNLVTLVFQNE